MTEQAVAVGKLEQRVQDLERWQAAQNGSIQRVEARLWALMVTSFFTVVGLAANIIIALLKT